MKDESCVEETTPISVPFVLYQLVHQWMLEKLRALTVHLQIHNY